MSLICTHVALFLSLTVQHRIVSADRESFRDPDPRLKNFCERRLDGSYEHPDYCTKYIICENEEVAVMECDQCFKNDSDIDDYTNIHGGYRKGLNRGGWWRGGYGDSWGWGPPWGIAPWWGNWFGGGGDRPQSGYGDSGGRNGWNEGYGWNSPTASEKSRDGNGPNSWDTGAGASNQGPKRRVNRDMTFGGDVGGLEGAGGSEGRGTHRPRYQDPGGEEQRQAWNPFEGVQSNNASKNDQHSKKNETSNGNPPNSTNTSKSRKRRFSPDSAAVSENRTQNDSMNSTNQEISTARPIMQDDLGGNHVNRSSNSNFFTYKIVDEKRKENEHEEMEKETNSSESTTQRENTQLGECVPTKMYFSRREKKCRPADKTECKEENGKRVS